MDDLTSKMDGVMVEEKLAATEVDLTPGLELAQAHAVEAIPGTALAAALGETV